MAVSKLNFIISWKGNQECTVISSRYVHSLVPFVFLSDFQILFLPQVCNVVIHFAAGWFGSWLFNKDFLNPYGEMKKLNQGSCKRGQACYTTYVNARRLTLFEKHCLCCVCQMPLMELLSYQDHFIHSLSHFVYYEMAMEGSCLCRQQSSTLETEPLSLWLFVPAA